MAQPTEDRPDLEPQCLRDVRVQPLTDSPYLSQWHIAYKMNGQSRVTAGGAGRGSVAILLWHTDRKQFLLVRQLRPSVLVADLVRTGRVQPTIDALQQFDWTTADCKDGRTIELCAGLLDKPELSVEQTAAAEVLEECGYRCTKPLQRLYTAKPAHHVYWTEIDESMRVTDGGGCQSESEIIVKVWMSLPDLKQYLSRDRLLSPQGFAAGISHWLLKHGERVGIAASEFDWVGVRPPVEPLTFPIDPEPLTDVAVEQGMPRQASDHHPAQSVFKLVYKYVGEKDCQWDVQLIDDHLMALVHDRRADRVLLMQRCLPSLFVTHVFNAERSTESGVLAKHDSRQSAYCLGLPYVLSKQCNDVELRKRLKDMLGLDVADVRLLKSACVSLGIHGDFSHLFYCTADGLSSDVPRVVNDETMMVWVTRGQVSALLQSTDPPSFPSTLYSLSLFLAQSSS